MTTATRRTSRRTKKNLCFTFEFRNCLDLFCAPIGLKICNATVQFQIKMRKSSRRRCLRQNNQNLAISRFVLQRRPKKCAQIYNARAEPLFCSLNLLFGGVLVAVAVGDYLTSQVSPGRPPLWEIAFSSIFVPLRVAPNNGHCTK